MRKSAIPGKARTALGTTGILITLAELIGDGTLGLVVGFISFGLVVYAMARIPMRYSMMGLAFLATVLPNPGEGQPTHWAPPFSVTGQALLNHLNTLDREGILGVVPVSTLELLLFVLFLILLVRKGTKSTLDRDVIPTPRPLIRLAQLALAGSCFTWFHGLLFGGDFGKSLWQVSAVIFLPLIFLLFQAGFRGPADHWSLARLCLIAATYKCLLALYVVETIVMPVTSGIYGRPAYGTAHADSMLFTFAFVIVLAPLLERVGRRWYRLAAVLLPILVLGTNANNRRLAWVQLGVVVLIVYLVSRESRLKRLIRKTVFVSVPLVAIYASAGWTSQYGGFFKPVRVLRSVVDAESDGSSRWREFENVNIISTFRDNPIFGTGFGHPYKEIIVLPAIDYQLERYIPHNSLLGLWAYTGLVGFACLTLLWVAGIYFAMRAYHAATDPQHRAAAIVGFGAVPIYMLQSWGDLGLGTWSGVFMMSAALTVAGKLAVATGQWDDRTGFRV
jgi:O-antigen ligase